MSLNWTLDSDTMIALGLGFLSFFLILVIIRMINLAIEDQNISKDEKTRKRRLIGLFGVLGFILIPFLIGSAIRKLQEEQGGKDIPKAVMVGESGVLGSEQMRELYRKMTVKTPSELVRKALVEGDSEELLKAIALWDPKEGDIVEVSKGLRIAGVLRDMGRVKEARAVLGRFLSGEEMGYEESVRKLVERELGREVEVDNTEKLLAVVVIDYFDLLTGGVGTNGVGSILEQAFEDSDFDLMRKSGDYGQIYMWQLIGVYSPGFYQRKLKERLGRVYRTDKPFNSGSMRYMESELIFNSINNISQ